MYKMKRKTTTAAPHICTHHIEPWPVRNTTKVRYTIAYLTAIGRNRPHNTRPKCEANYGRAPNARMPLATGRTEAAAADAGSPNERQKYVKKCCVCAQFAGVVLTKMQRARRNVHTERGHPGMPRITITSTYRRAWCAWVAWYKWESHTCARQPYNTNTTAHVFFCCCSLSSPGKIQGGALSWLYENHSACLCWLWSVWQTIEHNHPEPKHPKQVRCGLAMY